MGVGFLRRGPCFAGLDFPSCAPPPRPSAHARRRSCCILNLSALVSTGAVFPRLVHYAFPTVAPRPRDGPVGERLCHDRALPAAGSSLRPPETQAPPPNRPDLWWRALCSA